MRGEIESLKRFRGQEHIVELLSAFQLRQRIFMIFPWANSNLQEFWQKNSAHGGSSTVDLERWISTQALGLAEAIQTIHTGLGIVNEGKRYGRHGDIKPENILWFKATDDSEHSFYSGTLKLADFGSAQFQSVPGSTVQATNIRGVTSTYQAPELDLAHPISQAYDMWCFGCVLLDFVIWYQHGWRGIYQFSRDRVADSEEIIKMDTYYSIHIDTQSRQLSAKLKPSVARVRTTVLCYQC